MSWDTWPHAYIAAMEHRGLAPITIARRSLWLWRLQAFCAARALEPAAVTLVHVWDFATVLGARYTVLSQRDALQSIRHFFRWAVRSQRLLVDPTAMMELPKHEHVEGLFLSLTQVAGLLCPVPPETPVALRNRSMLETLYGTGMRRHELLGLDLAAFNRRDGWFSVFSKGHRERLVVVGSHLAHVLDEYLTTSRPRLVWSPGQTAFFVSKDGERLQPNALTAIVATAGRRIGLPRLGSHSLRRACANHMLAAGARIESVQQLLGHANLSTTDYYLQLSWDDLRAEHERAHPRNRWSPDGDDLPA